MLTARTPRQLPRELRSTGKVLTATAAAVVTLAVSGCGLLNGSGGDDQQPSAPGRTSINVGTMPVLATAAFQLAVDKGYFQQAGLDVHTRTLPGGAAAVPLLKNGDLDVAWGNWPSFIKAQGEGAADLKLITDGYQASDGMMMVQTAADSPIKRVEDLRGKTIAINTNDNIIELITRSVLETHGVPQDSVKFRTMDFPAMPAALRNHSVDAATLTEPFVAKANQAGSVALADAASGPTTDIPIAGFAASSRLTQQNPAAVAKFQQVMARASNEANQDRTQVEQELPKYSKVDPTTAKLVQIGTFPTTLEPRRLTRVSDLMQRFGKLPNGQPVDVRSMIYPMQK